MADALQGVSAPAEGLELTAPTPGRITGRVTDAQTRAAVTDFEVELAPDRSSGRGGFGPGGRGGGFGGAALAGGGRSGLLGRAGGRDRKGVHSEDGTFALDDVPAGSWELTEASR